jgi:hypothetical protein
MSQESIGKIVESLNPLRDVSSLKKAVKHAFPYLLKLGNKDMATKIGFE